MLFEKLKKVECFSPMMPSGWKAKMAASLSGLTATF
jgi:hypothetical protein